jgi:hypothetical protein
MYKLIHHGSGNDRRMPNPGELRTRMGNRILSTTSSASVISNATNKPRPSIGKDSDLQAGSAENVHSSTSQRQQALIHRWHELMHRSPLLPLMLMMRLVAPVSTMFCVLAVFALPRWSWPSLAYATYTTYAVCLCALAPREASSVHPFLDWCTVVHHNCPIARSPSQVLCYHADCVLCLSS